MHNIAANTGPMNTGVTSVGASAAAISPSLNTPLVYGVHVSAPSGNTQTIYLGGPAVTTSNGYPLLAGKDVLIPIEDIGNLYAVTPSGPQTLNWFAG